MGMRAEDFDAMTPAQFIYAWLGWMDLERGRMRQSWELHRWSVWVQITAQLPEKDRKEMSEVLPLPWDSHTTPIKTEPSMQERLERVNKIKSILKK